MLLRAILNYEELFQKNIIQSLVKSSRLKILENNFTRTDLTEQKKTSLFPERVHILFKEYTS